MSERREPLDASLLLVHRFPELTEEHVMVIAGIPGEEIRHTRAVHWLAEGRQEGEAAVSAPRAIWR